MILALPTNAVASRRTFDKWLWSAAALSFVISLTPWGALVLYPFRLFTTWVHESGHALVTLIVGGHITANSGLADTTIFDSRTNTYFRGRDMSVGRWYPTATVLPDGRVLVIAGDNIVTNRTGQPHFLKDASVNSLPEIFNPRTNTWTPTIPRLVSRSSTRPRIDPARRGARPSGDAGVGVVAASNAAGWPSKARVRRARLIRLIRVRSW